MGGIRMGYGNQEERCWIGEVGESTGSGITAVISGIREDAVAECVESAMKLAKALDVQPGRVLLIDVTTATVRVVAAA